MGAVEEMMCVVCVDVTEGYRGDECDLASNLCKYDLKTGDLFVLNWARVRRVMRGSLFKAANVWWRCAQFAMCLGVVAILLLNVMDVFSVCGGALLDRPCMVLQSVCVLCL